MAKIGIIGGTGMKMLSFFSESEQIEIKTRYGTPSSSLLCGKIDKTELVLLIRHGQEHTIPPSQVNYRANISALKEIGCTHIIATTACGSLKELYKMGDFVVLDQFIDFTRHRENTFHDSFAPHAPMHVSMAEPFDNNLRNKIIDVAKKIEAPFHAQGTVISIEGPRFSTRAESNMFRMFGADVINMTIATECALAKELNIPYAAIALVTDYDCWKEDSEDVSWDIVLTNFNKNIPILTHIIHNTVLNI